MSAGQKRMTFAKTKEMEEELNYMKKEFFYSHTYSYMLRELIILGLRAAKGQTKQNRGNVRKGEMEESL